MTDADIILHLKNGHIQKAVKGLYGYLPAIRKMVVSNNGRKEDAEDICQETLLLLYRKSRETDFQLTSSLKTYAFAVARNLWLQELRKRGREVPHGFEQSVDEPVDEHEDTLRTAEKAFLLLGEQCRTILLMFYKQKFSMQEIASRLGFASEQVAKNQKYRCIEKARSNFKSLRE